MMTINEFYLKDYDFQIYVNKGCQTYGRTPAEMFEDPIVKEYYKSLREGGCNYRAGKQANRTADSGSAGQTGANGAATH